MNIVLINACAIAANYVNVPNGSTPVPNSSNSFAIEFLGSDNSINQASVLLRKTINYHSYGPWSDAVKASKAFWNGLRDSQTAHQARDSFVNAGFSEKTSSESQSDYACCFGDYHATLGADRAYTGDDGDHGWIYPTSH
jgi:hypothetical protein